MKKIKQRGKNRKEKDNDEEEMKKIKQREKNRKEKDNDEEDKIAMP